MRIFIKTLSVFLMLIITGSICVYAADSYVAINGFTFYINSSGDVVIHGYDNRSKNVVIPNTIMGAKVTAIDDYAFFENTEIESVTFEDDSLLEKIGTDAFNGCTGLVDITIPSSVSEIAFGAFQNCTNLKTVTLSGGLSSIANQTFYNCSSLERIVIPDGVVSLGNRCFSGCTSLVDIEIPDSVTDISEKAFVNTSDELVIYCGENSYAASYAEMNGVPSELPDKYVLGDANLDGRFNILDATIIQKYKIGQVYIPEFRGINYADVNGDGTVTIRDATLIQMKLARIITEF